MKFPKFLAGLLFGVIIGLIIWYWQKSTSAEEGALAVLDRLAKAELRVRDLEARLRLAHEGKGEVEQPEVLSGLPDLWGLDSGGEKTDSVEPEDEVVEELEDRQQDQPDQDNLQTINGIGPAYERRLNAAGVLTYQDLIQKTPDELREIAKVKSWQATDPEQWIEEAKMLLQE